MHFLHYKRIFSNHIGIFQKAFCHGSQIYQYPFTNGFWDIKRLGIFIYHQYWSINMHLHPSRMHQDISKDHWQWYVIISIFLKCQDSFIFKTLALLVHHHWSYTIISRCIFEVSQCIMIVQETIYWDRMKYQDSLNDKILLILRALKITHTFSMCIVIFLDALT